MSSFRLEVSMNRNDPPTELMIEADDREMALREAGSIIAGALGRSGEFVFLDDASGKFTVGAGLWSRSGFYRLSPDAGPPRAPTGR